MYHIGGEFMSENNDKPDFMPIGQALKRAREARGVTREQLAGIIDKAPRHIQAIENEGQLPSVELLFQLASMFDISIDQYIFPDDHSGKSSTRRQVDSLLDKMNDRELSIIAATADSIYKAREPED